uniref:Protein-serine/threonine kinase n=1 Tax=Albugo laibachii Nc14 TaxID=890382 RepID=F0WW98_9STRA|nr:pyruvate dehydrogenase putative [Albugo laibachii Nc14]|eukprot:CCA25718.1 pyruvate dehydrogenase putative [Albugo laibachii Nc14]
MTSKLLAEVYRLHHIPLPPITLQALLQRGPIRPPAVRIIEWKQSEHKYQEWKVENAPAILQSARQLHREVPIRLARRIVELENLPSELLAMPNVGKIRGHMLTSFEKMIQSREIRTLEDEQRFMDMHTRIRREHRTVHADLAVAVQSMEKDPCPSAILDEFYDSRIGIRMLLDQHVASTKPVLGYSGLVADSCAPLKIAEDLIELVTPLWRSQLASVHTNSLGEPNSHLILPEIKLYGDQHATYRYIPQHIEIILLEVVKNAVMNSMNAWTKASNLKDNSTPPSVKIRFAGGKDSICIKVSDQGSGMTRDKANALLSYIRPKEAQNALKTRGHINQYDPVAADLEHRASGLTFYESFGLRVASRYARYFGGALTFMPMEKHGLDAYIYLNCLHEAKCDK